MSETADAEIGLLTFRDHLGQAGLGAIAVENVRSAGDGRLVRRAARENVVVANLRIEERQDIVELDCGRGLGRRLAVVVELECTLLIDRLHRRASGRAELSEHRLRNAQCGAHRRRGVAIAGESRKLRVERQGYAGLRLQAGISLRCLSARQFLTQRVG